MEENTYFDEKVKFLSKEFTYEFDREKYILKLFTNNDENLRNELKKNFKEIYDMKNIIINSNNGRYKWYIESCLSSFANEIIFKVKYFMESFAKETRYSKIIVTSEVINQIFHPAKYFYNNIEKANTDILYNQITLKQFEFTVNDIKYNVRIYMGDLLERGICSHFSNMVKLEVIVNKELLIEDIIEIIDSIKVAFYILGQTKRISFENIEIFNDKNKRLYMHEKPIEINELLPNVNLFFNEIFMKILKNSMRLKNIEYKLFEDNDNEINFFFLCRAFEQNFKIKFPQYNESIRQEHEEKIIKKLLSVLKGMEQNSFVLGIENMLHKYKNKFFNQLLYTFQYYEDYFYDIKKYSFAIDSIRYLKKKELGDFKYEKFNNSANRISKLRNIMAHEDLNVTFSIIDKLWINAFGYIVYIMILENLQLSKDEIYELLEKIYIHIIN